MNQFRHHQDGVIYINDNFQCKLEDFLTLEPDYKLPEGIIGQEYFQGKTHRVYTENSEDLLDPVWEEGDKYISKVEEYMISLIKSGKYRITF